MIRPSNERSPSIFDNVRLNETSDPAVTFCVIISKTIVAFGKGGGPIVAINERDDTDSFIETFIQRFPSVAINVDSNSKTTLEVPLTSTST